MGNAGQALPLDSCFARSVHSTCLIGSIQRLLLAAEITGTSKKRKDMGSRNLGFLTSSVKKKKWGCLQNMCRHTFCISPVAFGFAWLHFAVAKMKVGLCDTCVFSVGLAVDILSHYTLTVHSYETRVW
jgi:hypothetical protein